MSPIFLEIYDESLTPYLNEQINAEQAIQIAEQPLRDFMLRQTREDDLSVFSDMGMNIKVSKMFPKYSAPFVHDLRTKDGFYDWLSHLYTFRDNRSRRSECADVDGYDDAFTNDDIDAFKTYAICTSGRMDLGNAITGG